LFYIFINSTVASFAVYLMMKRLKDNFTVKSVNYVAWEARKISTIATSVGCVYQLESRNCIKYVSDIYNKK